MARIRCVKPEFWVSEQLAECSTNARLTFIGLWNFCDDNGVHPAKPRTLKAELYPMDDFSSGDVEGWVGELVRTGLVIEFESAGEAYWHVTGWARHQKIDRPSFKYPAPPDQNSGNGGRTLAEDSTSPRRAPPPGVERSGEERKGVEGRSPKARASTPSKAKTPIPPDFGLSSRVRDWAAQHAFADLEQHLEAFKAKCAANGYTYVDWDAAFMEAVRGNWAKLRRGGSAAHWANGDRNHDARPPTTDDLLARDARPPWLDGTGFDSVFDAEGAGCGPGNAKEFSGGRRIAA